MAEFLNGFLRHVLLLPEQGSTMARQVDWLHYFVILVTMAGAAGVALATFGLLIRYGEGSRAGQRARDGEAVALAPKPSRSGLRAALGFELMVVFGLLSLFVFWWVIGFGQFVRLHEPPPD